MAIIVTKKIQIGTARNSEKYWCKGRHWDGINPAGNYLFIIVWNMFKVNKGTKTVPGGAAAEAATGGVL